MRGNKLENFDTDVKNLVQIDAIGDELMSSFQKFCALNLESLDMGTRPYILSISNFKRVSKNEAEFSFFGENFKLRYDVYPKEWIVIFSTYREETDSTNYPSKNFIIIKNLTIRSDSRKVVVRTFNNAYLENGVIERDYIELLYDDYCERVEKHRKQGVAS